MDSLRPTNSFINSPIFTALTAPAFTNTKPSSSVGLASLSDLHTGIGDQILTNLKIPDLDSSLTEEFRKVILNRLGKDENEQKTVLKKIFEEYGFKDPLFIIEKAAQIRLEKLAAPEKVKNELREIMGVLNSKTHNLSGFLPKAYSAAAIGAAHEYQKMMGEKEKVQVFFGDYANLGKTNEHFENLTQVLLNLCLGINSKEEIGIKKASDAEKEDTIKFLEKVFFNKDKSHSLILSRDWEILKSIIRSKDDGPYSEHMIMVDSCRHPVLAKRALKSIAEKAGAVRLKRNWMPGRKNLQSVLDKEGMKSLG